MFLNVNNIGFLLTSRSKNSNISLQFLTLPQNQEAEARIEDGERGSGDKETRGQGEGEARRQGDKGTRGQEDYIFLLLPRAFCSLPPVSSKAAVFLFPIPS